MAFPTAANETLSICFYSAEVAGRALGLSEAETLIPEAERRAVLKSTGESIANTTKALRDLCIARIIIEFFDNRLALGKGKGIDRAFDRFNALTSETIRNGVAGGNRNDRSYLKVYETGSPAPFQDPTIREDPELCVKLAAGLDTLPDDFKQKAALLADLQKLKERIDPAAGAISTGEKQLSDAFRDETKARQTVIDALWVGKKAVEQAFIRDRNTVAFIFFDFRKEKPSTSASEPTPGTGDTTGVPADSATP
jgi:hypothetical protein